MDGDSIKADKGCDIEDDLQKIGLYLNIPPFVKEKPQFSESEVIKTQAIAKNRIHVERIIGKVGRFLIFNSRKPNKLTGNHKSTLDSVVLALKLHGSYFS